jgi:hypothetical protein
VKVAGWFDVTTTTCDGAAAGAVAVSVRVAGLPWIGGLKMLLPFSDEAASTEDLAENSSASNQTFLEIERHADNVAE